MTKLRKYFVIVRLPFATRVPNLKVYLTAVSLVGEEKRVFPVLGSTRNIFFATLFHSREEAERMLETTDILKGGLFTSSYYAIEEIMSTDEAAKGKVWRS